jgi:transcription antitermination protein NusB
VANVGGRRRARECALQVLYSLDLNPGWSVDQALAGFWRDFSPELEEDKSVDPQVVEFADKLVRGTVGHQADLDRIIQGASKNWRLERMARVDRNILRLATYELHHEPDVPAKVVINEAIEVAKRFGTAESPAFVNGLLDRISQEAGRA